jgi:hypothetical protein
MTSAASTHALVALVVLIVASLSGCASSAPPALADARPPDARPFDGVRRIAIVVTGESRFTVLEHSAQPGRTFDEVLRWTPYQSLLQPLAVLVHQGINWLLQSDRAETTGRKLAGISPGATVGDAFAGSLAASDQFQEIRLLDREPVGEDRRRADAIVRLTVPTWGIVRVREGDPDLLSGFADVRAEMTLRGTGVVVWDNVQDVTDPERLPLDSFRKNTEFTRQHLLDVLTRAGERLASELLYARSAGR